MDAVAEAKRRAGMDERDRITLDAVPDQPGLLGQLLALRHRRRHVAAPSETDVLARILAPALRGLPGSLFFAPSTPQARLDFDVSDAD